MSTRATQYKYKIKLAYIDQVRNKSTYINTENIKFMIIDHNYDINCMPEIFINISLDKKILDDMILNSNNNLIMLSLNKYDNIASEKQDIECFRKRFIYIIPNDVNKTDSVDYNETTQDELLGDVLVNVTIGLLCVDHINNNKRNYNFLLNNANIGSTVKDVMSHFNNLIMEPIGEASLIPQLLIEPKNSVKSTLRALNKEKVFYNTPYRYYQDFNYTYLLSSSGTPIKKQDDLYTSVIVEIEDIDSVYGNDVGVILNRKYKTFQVPVNYANTQVYDNAISNKSQTEIIGMTTSGDIKKELKNNTSYLKNKSLNIKVDDERELMNIESNINNNNFFISIQKEDLDTDVFTINKRITVHNINRYKEHNGNYLMFRKREYYMREDDSFVMSSIINLKQIQQ